ncbi:hypothetical protein ACFQX6_52285 [Streptosporangium lutulentum]
MTQPLLAAQRSRGDLIAELYDRHATGLFAYCHDQLGDAAPPPTRWRPSSPSSRPRTRRAPPCTRWPVVRSISATSSTPCCPLGADPAAALVERVLRELRPHQREVLYLSGMCEMGTDELSWVLDVAADTADELTLSACRRFAQSLTLALASTRIPDHLSDVFGAMSVAPIRDVLTRAPWAVPPAGLRAALLGPRAVSAAAARRASSPLVKQLWPTTPAWPLPLSETDPSTGSARSSLDRLPDQASPPDSFPDPFSPTNRSPDPFTPPDPAVVSAHEAATAPMPKLRDSVLTSLDGDAATRVSRLRLQRPKPRRAMPLSAPIPADVLDDARAENPSPPLTADVPADDLFRPFTPGGGRRQPTPTSWSPRHSATRRSTMGRIRARRPRRRSPARRAGSPTGPCEPTSWTPWHATSTRGPYRPPGSPERATWTPRRTSNAGSRRSPTGSRTRVTRAHRITT